MARSPDAWGSRVAGVRFSEHSISVELADGRTITAPLAWYPRLLDASDADRGAWELAGAGQGIHWSALDEDLSVEGLLLGAPGAHVMHSSFRDSLRLSAIIDHDLVEMPPPPVSELLTMLGGGRIWGDASLHPRSGQFPRATVSHHDGHGFVIQCFEDEHSWSDFLVSAEPVSTPSVEINLGGQALEAWPPELFVPRVLASEALECFVENGTQKRSLEWVRIDRFPRRALVRGSDEPDNRSRKREPT